MQGGECRQSALQALRVMRSEGVSLRELSQRVDTNSRLAAKRRGYCCSARLVSSRQWTCSRRGSGGGEESVGKVRGRDRDCGEGDVSLAVPLALSRYACVGCRRLIG